MERCDKFPHVSGLNGDLWDPPRPGPSPARSVSPGHRCGPADSRLTPDLPQRRCNPAPRCMTGNDGRGRHTRAPPSVGPGRAAAARPRLGDVLLISLRTSDGRPARPASTTSDGRPATVDQHHEPAMAGQHAVRQGQRDAEWLQWKCKTRARPDCDINRTHKDEEDAKHGTSRHGTARYGTARHGTVHTAHGKTSAVRICGGQRHGQNFGITKRQRPRPSLTSSSQLLLQIRRFCSDVLGSRGQRTEGGT